MNHDRGHRRSEDELDGYPSGPDAPIEATAAALDLVRAARIVLLVEGISDQIALETLAHRYDRDLGAEGIAILPIGGAHATGRYLRQLGPEGAGLTIAGLCDANEEAYVRRALAAGGVGTPQNRADLEELRFFVCEEDLEDELIRACGREPIEAVLASRGELVAFRTLQKQPAWRDENFEAQMRRWLGAGSRRKLRYARLLVLALDLNNVPRPLEAVLATSGPPAP